ncbi:MULTISPECIES: DUF3168 domain-containing protein [unclassified Bradyrhizobium]
MTSPTLELQGAVVARLKAFPGLTTLVGNRIYDNVPEKATFPYVSWGPEQAISDNADCITGFNVTIQIDAWSRTVGLPEVKQIAEQVRIALHEYDLTLTANALVSIEYSQTRTLRDPDGLTNHAVIEFTAFIEQP